MTGLVQLGLFDQGSPARALTASISDTPSEGELWVPERRTRVSRSSFMRGASVRAPRHRPTTGAWRLGRAAPRGPAPPRHRTSEEALSAQALSRGSTHARQRRREHGPDRDTPHGWVRTRGALKKDSRGPD